MAGPELLADVVADPLVLGVVRGDRAAWFQLTLCVEAWVSTRVPRHWRMRKARLQGSDDDVRDVLLEVIERIDRDNFRALRQYLERKLAEVPDVRAAEEQELSQISFVGWLEGLTDYAIRDHVRRRYGRSPAARAEPSPIATLTLSKRDLQSWAVHPTQAGSSQFGLANAAMSTVLTARSILRYAAEAFTTRELDLLRRYLEQASYEELAQEFGLAEPQLARAEIRKLKERLRTQFREGG